MKLDLGILFAHWLQDNLEVESFDYYVEKYKNDTNFQNKVNDIDVKIQYKKIGGENE